MGAAVSVCGTFESATESLNKEVFDVVLTGLSLQIAPCRSSSFLHTMPTTTLARRATPDSSPDLAKPSDFELAREMHRIVARARARSER